jgi:hypothetical protein
MERATLDERTVDVADALGTTAVAVVRYRLTPGEGFPSGLHAHDEQEEVFLVLASEAVFEVLPPAAEWPESDAESPSDDVPTGREVTVAASECLRFAPGEFQTGRNAADASGDLVALALGAPKGTQDVRIPAPCPACDAPALGIGTGGDAFTLDCPACDHSFDPAPCHDCGSHHLGMHLDADGHPISRCGDCGREYDRPPLTE